MKKRSLVAALAMLMVSAIVLTSSTYAWFATGTTAKVSSVTASVVNDQGNITISADGTNYATALDYSAFKEISANYVPQYFKPVSFNPSAMTFVAGSIMQDEKTPDNGIEDGALVFNPTLATNDNDKFIKLTVHIKASVDCSVTVAADMAQSAKQFIYAAVVENDNTTNYKVYNSAARTYQAVTAATQGIDVDTNGIMNADKDTLVGGQPYNALTTEAVTSTTNDTITISLTKDTAKQITLYVWAEGNDSLCVGNVNSQECTVGLNFTKI